MDICQSIVYIGKMSSIISIDKIIENYGMYLEYQNIIRAFKFFEVMERGEPIWQTFMYFKYEAMYLGSYV